MGLLDTSLQIGRSAIMANSLAMDVVGNNIANAGTEGYARQVVDLRSVRGIPTGSGAYLGMGVNADRIRRVSDMYLEQRLRDARSDTQALSAQDDMFRRMEGAFNELTDNDLSSAVDAFFSALNTLQANPEERSIRRSVVETASTFTETVRGMREKLDDLRVGLNGEIAGAVGTVNGIAREIAGLNQEISRIEAASSGNTSATSLRDRRDLLLGQLSDLAGIRTVELGNGMVSVFLGADPLVMNDRSYELTTETRIDRGVSVSDVTFADGRPADIRSGKIAGLTEARDEGATEFIDDLEKWAAAFIQGFNEIHSSGSGLDRFTDITGTNGVADPAAALSAAGLAFTPRTGAFEITVKNGSSGEARTFRAHVDLDGLGGDDTTLSSLVNDINAQISAAYPQVRASVGPGNTLRISSSLPDLTFSFGNDTSGALAALGVNTFLTGTGAGDIDINAMIVENPGFIAAGLTDKPGDNANAIRLVAFQRQGLSTLEGSSVQDYYQGIVTTLGVRAAAATDKYVGGQSIQAALSSQREAMSGVSLDEEAVKLIRYQSGYAAAARYISAVDELIKVLLNM